MIVGFTFPVLWNGILRQTGLDKGSTRVMGQARGLPLSMHGDENQSE
jgi:hypothetical protein